MWQIDYVALSEAVSELPWMRDLSSDFEIKLESSIKVCEDNSGAVSIAKFGNYTKSSKYIETHFHFVNNNNSKGIIDIVKIDTH